MVEAENRAQHHQGEGQSSRSQELGEERVVHLWPPEIYTHIILYINQFFEQSNFSTYSRRILNAALPASIPINMYMYSLVTHY